METRFDPCCGIDVHKRGLVACVRRGKESTIRKFGTTTADILDLIQWITDNGCQQTVMESTGSYWIPVWNIFEEKSVPIILANAWKVKAIPGKKTDSADAAWLAQLLAEGHIDPSFIPDRKHRELRAIVVQRSKYIGERSSERNRVQKILTASNTQLSNVVADVYGKSAQVLLKEMLTNGAPSPERIRQLQAQKKVSRNLQSTPEEISAALAGVITEDVRFQLEHIEEHIVFLDKQIAEYTQKIRSMLDEHEMAGAKLLTSMTGIGEDSAIIIISIIGSDMSRFETANKLCSWAGVVPGNNESAGKRKSSRTTKGHALLKSTLVVCAHSAAHSKNTFLGSRYRRLVARLGAKKSIMALAHSMLKAIWYMLSTGEVYSDLGEDYYLKHDRVRQIRAHINKLKKLGLDTQSAEAQLDAITEAADKAS